MQASGEDWSQVRLRLSTGQPTRNTQGAMPRPWVVDVIQPIALAAPAPAPAMMARASSASDIGRTCSLRRLFQYWMSPASTPRTARSLWCPTKSPFPPAPERTTLSLGQENLATSLLTRTAPAVEDAAYLIAIAAGAAYASGLQASITLFRDDALVGNGRLDFGNAQALGTACLWPRAAVVRRLPAQSNTGSSGWPAARPNALRSYAGSKTATTSPLRCRCWTRLHLSNEQIKVIAIRAPAHQHPMECTKRHDFLGTEPAVYAAQRNFKPPTRFAFPKTCPSAAFSKSD